MLTRLFNAERSEEIGVTNEFDFPPKAEGVHRGGTPGFVFLSDLVRGNRALHSAFGGMCSNVYVYDGLGFRSASLSHVAERN